MPGLLDPAEYDRRLAARDPWRAWGDRFRRQVARSRTPEEAAEDAARQRANPLTLMEGIEAASMSPSPLGDVASGVLAARDLAAGDYLGAGLNAVGLLPLVPALGAMLARTPDAIPEAARRLGFNAPVWHATKAGEDFAAFDPTLGEGVAVHVATRPETAWSRIEGFVPRLAIAAGEPWAIEQYQDRIRGGRVLPLVARLDPARTVRLPDPGNWAAQWNIEGKWFDRVPGYEGGYTPVRSGTWPGDPPWPASGEPEKFLRVKPGYDLPDPLRAEMSRYFADIHDRSGRRDYSGPGDMAFKRDLREMFRRHNIDAIRYPNDIEGIGEDSIAILDPSLLRLPWASFDPRRLSSSDLLAGLAPATLATGVTLRGLLGDDDDDGAL